ncbi:hypothetical protein VTO73DRAFT_12845 [Trametes versicolor]
MSPTPRAPALVPALVPALAPALLLLLLPLALALLVVPAGDSALDSPDTPGPCRALRPLRPWQARPDVPVSLAAAVGRTVPFVLADSIAAHIAGAAVLHNQASPPRPCEVFAHTS